MDILKCSNCFSVCLHHGSAQPHLYRLDDLIVCSLMCYFFFIFGVREELHLVTHHAVLCYIMVITLNLEYLIQAKNLFESL